MSGNDHAMTPREGLIDTRRAQLAREHKDRAAWVTIQIESRHRLNNAIGEEKYCDVRIAALTEEIAKLEAEVTP